MIFDESIVNYIKKEYNLMIGERTAKKWVSIGAGPKLRAIHDYQDGIW